LDYSANGVATPRKEPGKNDQNIQGSRDHDHVTKMHKNYTFYTLLVNNNQCIMSD